VGITHGSLILVAAEMLELLRCVVDMIRREPGLVNHIMLPGSMPADHPHGPTVWKMYGFSKSH